MSGLRLIGVVLAIALPLFAQEQDAPKQDLSEHQLGAYKGDDDEVRTAETYCDAVDDIAQQQPPRIFAKLTANSTTDAKSPHWAEFASNEEWAAAGKPVPLAFVWIRDTAIVRVTIVEYPPRPRSPAVTHHRMDYCYDADTKLIRIRALWNVPTSCEFLFPCRLITGQEFFLNQNRWPGITDWVFTPDGTINKLRNGKAVDDYFDPSNSLSADDLHLKTSADLPFIHEGPK
jgi:hypothetical protein